MLFQKFRIKILTFDVIIWELMELTYLPCMLYSMTEIFFMLSITSCLYNSFFYLSK